ncbi:unnamed protein product [Acanthoscelides obtectus]|uniref:Reverse transcriptase domain-containing protein n=1 Tax=Acanthoscelides obtectus TaxID=200917 RepID=A0A9P0KW73_ACAOB|nr:unnamed protein product [Acanthoscelides obtectus]CAK1675585.1 Probable RNA-directed DNA polymerase from transposon BS [Acanthoscelides obtectus]
MFASTSQRNDDGLRASYNISLLIAKSGKPYTIGKLILPAVEEVLKTVLYKPVSDIIKRSNNTVERRIDEMSSDIESFLCNYLQTTHFFIQLVESTLPDNAALLLAYVIFIMNQEIYEELLFARILITDTKCESIFHVLKDYFIEKAIPLSNIISVATDGPPAMVGQPLTYLINKCFESGIYPSILKKGNIIPIHKSGTKTEVNNYRPISIISSVAKVFEKVLSTRLIRYLTKFKILSENQYGFTEGKATSDAITKIVNQIHQNIDNRIPSICIFVDLKKAFDTVNHKLLLEALERIGFRGNAYSLIENYLSNRPQSVQISGSFSKEMYIKCGVPQGTVLDDTAILYEGTDWSDLKNVIENDFIKIIRWFNSRKLSINYSKTHFLPFGSYAKHLPSYTNFSFNINDQKMQINRVPNIKYLGVVLDPHLRRDIHVNYILKKVRFVSYKIKYLGNILTEKYLRTLYHALIEPHLTYGILAWGAACSSHIYNLDVFQKSILKMIFKKPKLYPTEKLYADLYFLHSITHYHKFVNTDQKIKHNHYTRYKIRGTVVPQPHKSIMQRSYLYLAPKFYEIIPKDLKDLRFGNCFKRNLKKWLHSISRTEIHKLII